MTPSGSDRSEKGISLAHELLAQQLQEYWPIYMNKILLDFIDVLY